MRNLWMALAIIAACATSVHANSNTAHAKKSEAMDDSYSAGNRQQEMISAADQNQSHLGGVRIGKDYWVDVRGVPASEFSSLTDSEGRNLLSTASAWSSDNHSYAQSLENLQSDLDEVENLIDQGNNLLNQSQYSAAIVKYDNAIAAAASVEAQMDAIGDANPNAPPSNTILDRLSWVQAANTQIDTVAAIYLGEYYGY
ncbi:hypothetical protein [Crateriforma conspicua]|uniref:Uncharacterized protein n=1 Tax=Crateriforma conspicua TaxID=2527996 RepID=A0A5C5XR02_9PLAN|nr:hypothetical protein [Crateriforma conspicua]QDV66229.1 hypothetical protein Mal65_54050 [Crateriforma conspicua]TWT65637.1 hypothetical protein Pan14r_51840 [Crateriforma conspicua]